MQSTSLRTKMESHSMHSCFWNVQLHHRHDQDSRDMQRLSGIFFGWCWCLVVALKSLSVIRMIVSKHPHIMGILYVPSCHCGSCFLSRYMYFPFCYFGEALNPSIYIYTHRGCFNVLAWVLLNDSGIEHIGGDMSLNIPKADDIFMKVSKLVLL